MKPKGTPTAPKSATTVHPGYHFLLWLAIFGNSLFLIWQCLDRYLAPRFLLLSIVLTITLVLLRKDLHRNADWRLHTFDLLLIGWYTINAASLTWTFNWSEGIFYTQKTLLLFTTYWLFRQAWLRHEARMTQTFTFIILVLTWVTCAILLVQIGMAFSKNGFDNETLYSYTSGVFGNKSLACDFLFFLLILNALNIPGLSKKGVEIINIAMSGILILLLQTRTVYLAVFAGTLLYAVSAGIKAPEIRPVFIRWVLPALAGIVIAIGGLILLRGGNGGLAERLNPLTFMESATANERKFVWYKTDLLNQDHFWLGVGNGSWKFWLPSQSLQGAYRLQEKGIIFTRAHNDYLEIRAEMGIIGSLWFIGLFLAAGIGLFMAFRQTGSPKHEIAVVGAGILGYCVIQYFDFPRERIEIQVMLALLFALAAHYSRSFWAKSPGIDISKWKNLFLLAVGMGLVFNIVIGWYRVDGEIHNVRMMKAYQKQDYPAVLREAQASENAFYQYNDVALPLQWYEGTAHYKMNQPEPAMLSFQEALALNPWSFQILNNYATALANLKRYHEAIPYFEKAVSINPKYDEGKFNLAYSYTQLGDYTTALEWVAKVDTIANPQSVEDKNKNKTLLENKVKFFIDITKKRDMEKK